MAIQRQPLTQMQAKAYTKDNTRQPLAQTQAKSFTKENSEAEHTVQTSHCLVEKHFFLGCAIVKVASRAIRDAVLHYIHLHKTFVVDGVNVHLAEHVPKDTDKKSDNALFAGWGRKTERKSPISATTLAKVLDDIIVTLLTLNPTASFAPIPEEMPICRFTSNAPWNVPQADVAWYIEGLRRL
eukprot:TRINITY_DN132_c1_g1_i1.p1 TRINITY_DN132_c1_g1~~TRINITY_DN132_c1_g1_i1.p1  ORF type:complete len:183 (-),score=25.91 TRINITY_DN132_c1_g1_i1:646-1194(-)